MKSYDEAIAFAKQKCSRINPNTNFERQLRTWK
eukprot:CAMPEP_0168570814 /NCGR_PEP_ID=MMETSP0413-20121227/16959_1 /TAXON_ID=136452 /ORGANISM="Filamoeba nolandi, Strain NC-AS-23-1" /LENGTH=32 /DNA_ID= /DNA_START= /DNA_END= /DNA_ORIENTATION=